LASGKWNKAIITNSFCYCNTRTIIV
jgi:hypothetical protein